MQCPQMTKFQLALKYCGILWRVGAILASQERGLRSWEARVWNLSHNTRRKKTCIRKHAKLPCAGHTESTWKHWKASRPDGFAMADVDIATASAEQLEQLAARLTSTERSNLQKALQLLASRYALICFLYLFVSFGYVFIHLFCTFALSHFAEIWTNISN